jgi:hypothetical protein
MPKKIEGSSVLPLSAGAGREPRTPYQQAKRAPFPILVPAVLGRFDRGGLPKRATANELEWCSAGNSDRRRSTVRNEPVRDVVAAWIVSAFAFAAGLSLLSLHERDVPGAVVP